MRVVGVIPARYSSTRFPGKPMAIVAGKPLLQWVVETCQKSPSLSEVIVATDHGEIFEFAEKLGVKVIMTAPELPSGSDRVYAAILNERADVVINIQGDEPLLESSLLDQLIAPFKNEGHLQMSTLATPIKSLEELNSTNVVKVVTAKNGDALYFSRFPMPYSRLDAEPPYAACSKHIGLYAYRKGFLAEFCRHPPVAMEVSESLEQLRALYLGATIRVVSVDCELQGVDTPEDVSKVESILAKKGSHGS